MKDIPESGPEMDDGSTPIVFERLFEHAPDAVLILDAAANQILRCNDRACERLGYDRDRLLSLGPADIHPHDCDVFEAFVERVHDRESGFTHGEFAAISAFLDDYPAVRGCELVDCRGETCVVEITVAGAPPGLLAEAGFSLVSLYASDGDTD